MSKRTRRTGETVFTKSFIDGKYVEVMDTYRVVKAWKQETLMNEINTYARIGYTVASWTPFGFPRVAILRKTVVAKLPEFDYNSIDVPDFVTAK
jgi:hypothetical protein